MIFGTENIPKRIRKNILMPYEVVTHDVVEEADVCIIGSGAAGSILANKILEGIDGFEGKNVILIEKGGYYDPEDFNQRGASMMKLLWKNGGAQFSDDLSLVIAQGECLGGSTTINDAVCFDTPDHIKKQWRDQYGVKIDDQKWESAIKEVKDRLSVKALTDDEIRRNKNALILKDACKNHSLEGQPQPYSGRPNERNCEDCATCGTCHYGCHYQTKQDMLNTYIFDALHIENEKKFKIFCNCDVRKINYENGTATGVEGKFLGEKGIEKFKLKVNAKVIILAAGSIASSALLLSNNIAYEKAGKGLAVHPSTTIIAKFKDEVRASEGIPMAYCCDQFSVLNYKDNQTRGGFMLESIFTPIIQFSMMLPEQHHEKLMKDFKYYAMAGVMVRDDPVGRIRLSKKGNPKIHYDLNDAGLNDLLKGIETIIRLYFQEGAEHVITNHGTTNVITKDGDIDSKISKIIDEIKSENNNKILTGLGSAHPQGGNRMGSNPTSCVVDENCQVYDFKNLFVCDASVFPTSLGVNPQITVMAIATMTAENILKTWDKKFEGIQNREYVGDTCDISHPRTCGLDALSIMFNQASNNGGLNEMENAKESDRTGWSFDENSLMIKNNFHWRGFIPDLKFPDFIQQFLQDGIIEWYDNYLEGFWKRFHKTEDQEIEGDMHSYLIENKTFKIIPEKISHEIYGDVIKLTYPKFPGVYDLIKIINENNIIGKVFLSLPLFPDLELGPFVMTKDYSAEWMDEDDHARILKSNPRKIDLDSTLGYWALRTVSEHLLSPVIEVFHFQKEEPWETKKVYCIGDWVKNPNIVYECKTEHTSGKANEPPTGSKWTDFWDKAKKPTEDLTEALLKEFRWIDEAEILQWTNYTHQINENFMMGKLESSPIDDAITGPSEHIEQNSEGKRVFVIRYSLSTVAGSWIRDQD